MWRTGVEIFQFHIIIIYMSYFTLRFFVFFKLNTLLDLIIDSSGLLVL